MGGMSGGMGGMSGGMGSMISSISQGVTGIGQLIGGGVKTKKAKSLEPSMEDPEQRAGLTDIKQRLRSASTGSDAMTQNAIRQSDQMMSATQSNIGSNVGGNAGAAISGMLKAQRVGGTNINESLARSRQLIPQLIAARTGMENQMAQRRLELQMRRQNQVKAEAEALKREGYQNLMGSIEGFFGGSATNKTGDNKVNVPQDSDEKSMDMSNPEMMSMMQSGLSSVLGG